MKKMGWLLLVLAALVAAASWWGVSREELPAVRLATATARNLTSRVLAQGRVRVKTQVDVTSEVAGRVAIVAVEVGEVVKKGDLLFALDGEQLRSAVEQIQATLTSAEALVARADVAVKEAERALSRDLQLANQGVLAEDVLKVDQSRLSAAEAERAQARANVERARVDLDRSKDALRRARVVAPLAGTVVAVGVEVGRVVSSATGMSASPDATLGLGLSGQAPVVIADLDDLVVKLDVDELDIARVRAGQRAVVRAQGIKDVAFDGIVDKVGLLGRDALGAVLFSVEVRITGSRRAEATASGEDAPASSSSSTPSVRPQSSLETTPRATLPLPLPQEVLRPGMTASAEIDVEHLEDALVIPLAAVLEATQDDDTKKPDRIFVVDAPSRSGDSPASLSEEPVLMVREVPVTLGPSEGDAIAVLQAAGLKAGMKVVEGPFRVLKDLEDQSRVREAADDKADAERAASFFAISRGKKSSKKGAP
jgi:multidrug efflux pump subunit AcrA (membrane-fusion protein)